MGTAMIIESLSETYQSTQKMMYFVEIIYWIDSCYELGISL